MRERSAFATGLRVKNKDTGATQEVAVHGVFMSSDGGTTWSPVTWSTTRRSTPSAGTPMVVPVRRLR